MSLFSLAALVKEPRFIPPHRLAVRRRYKWPFTENVREDEEEAGIATAAVAAAATTTIVRKKMFVGFGGGRTHREKSHGKFPCSSVGFSIFFPISCALHLYSVDSLHRTCAYPTFYVLNDGPLLLFPLPLCISPPPIHLCATPFALRPLWQADDQDRKHRLLERCHFCGEEMSTRKFKYLEATVSISMTDSSCKR